MIWIVIGAIVYCAFLYRFRTKDYIVGVMVGAAILALLVLGFSR